MIQKKMLINGRWITTEDTIKVSNPATEEVFATVPNAGEAEVEQAVSAAEQAFESWGKTTAFFRGELLRKASERIRENKHEIARLMTMEQGKPIQEAIGEVEKGAEILQYYAEEGERVYGRLIPSSQNGTESMVLYQPLGVVGCISPWNYPIELLAWKVAGAMAAGCTCVLKVPSETPLSPIAFVETMEKAGFPAGVINVITGPGRVVGNMLTSHPAVQKIAFTGSTAVGRTLMANAAQSLKRLSLELGGSLPMIVCQDCDLELAVQGAVRRSFRNMGQICIAINRIYVQRSIYQEFVEKFANEAKKLTIGNGAEGDFDLGPLCTANGLKTVQKHLQDGLKKGAKLVCGGKPPATIEGEKGYFFEPTILVDVNHSMLVMSEETFGPLVGVMPFDTLEEAITQANDSPYGLAAIGYTKNLSTATKLIQELQAGNVAINHVDAGVINAPYGGWKDSGYGHEHGPEGLFQYLHTKHARVRYE